MKTQIWILDTYLEFEIEMASLFEANVWYKILFFALFPITNCKSDTDIIRVSSILVSMKQDIKLNENETSVMPNLNQTYFDKTHI